MANNVLRVNYFQRRPRKGFNFSLEFIYDDLRSRLKDKVRPTTFISKCYNDGYFSKFINTIEAGFRQSNDINHITGELHFLDLLMAKRKVVLTILDCGMMKRKKGIAKKIVQWFYLSLPVARSSIVTAISEETKKEIIYYTGCDPDKIKVIPVAVSPIYQPCPKKFNEENPVILQIGTGPNKNLLRLAEALAGMKCHLSIVGKLSTEQLETLKANNIDYSNEYNISSQRLLQKYQECEILSFISTFEGFGMPIVEANSVERVVITGNISSMPEVAGKAAHLVDPYSVEDIRSGFQVIIQNRDYREKLLKEGRRNKLRFDGNNIAAMYYKLYLKLLSN